MKVNSELSFLLAECFISKINIHVRRLREAASIPFREWPRG
jgi:hypothetical protein